MSRASTRRCASRPRRWTETEYTLDQFLDELIAPTDGVSAVRVHKRRVRYTIGGCTSEVTNVVADGRQTRTIAIEGEDAAAVIAAVRGAGLGDFVNTPYPAGLRALLAEQPSRFAVIDVGTNSVKFHIAERRIDGSWHRVVDRAELTRLGEGIEATGEIGREAIDRTADAIARMVTEAKEAGVLAIAAVGTAGLRIARNRDAVLAEIKRRSGVGCEVVSGEEESRLAYLAVVEGIGLAQGSLVVFDTGGGSSQFTFGTDAWRRGAFQRRRRGGSLHRALRPGWSCLDRCPCRGARGDLDRPRSARRPAVA